MIDGAHAVAAAHGLQHVHRAHDIGRVRLDRVGVGAPHQRLRRHVEHDLGRCAANARSSASRSRTSPSSDAVDPRRRAPARTATGSVGGAERVARHLGAEAVQPQRQPAPLKPVCPVTRTRRPRQKLAVQLPHLPRRRARRPRALRGSACRAACPSACQKPVVLEGRQLASRARGAPAARAPRRCRRPRCSRPTSGESTKKPPLIQPPSPCGFSWKPRTRSPSSCSAPNRPGGCTAVTVASLPCARWKSISAPMSTSATPSP